MLISEACECVEELLESTPLEDLCGISAKALKIHLRTVLGMSTVFWRRHKARIVSFAKAKMDEIEQDFNLQGDSEEESGPEDTYDPRYGREVSVEPLTSDSEPEEEPCPAAPHRTVYKSNRTCKSCRYNYWRIESHVDASNQDLECALCNAPVITYWRCGCHFTR